MYVYMEDLLLVSLHALAQSHHFMAKKILHATDTFVGYVHACMHVCMYVDGIPTASVFAHACSISSLHGKNNSPHDRQFLGYVHACMYACVHVCMCACVHVCMWMEYQPLLSLHTLAQSRPLLSGKSRCLQGARTNESGPVNAHTSLLCMYYCF
jgi:hypothetical protein